MIKTSAKSKKLPKAHAKAAGDGDERISIFEVAKQAGCSIATVSNVLNHRGRVGEAKRKLVLKTVASLGYTTNAAGRNLRTRCTETFGLLFYPSCAEIFGNIFYAKVMEGLEERLTKAGYHLLLAGYEVSTAASAVPSFLTSGKVDGMILLGRFPSSVIQAINHPKVPLLLLDSNVEWPIDSVVSDGFSAGVAIVRHLHAKGHRRIVMMAFPWEDYNIDLRIQGFIAGMHHQGLPVGEDSIIRHSLDKPELYAALKKRLESPEPPTALVAVNDTLAAIMYDLLRADGYEIPRDLSIVGYDDDAIASEIKPALTTIRIDKKELGRVGAELLLTRVNSPKALVTKLRLPTELIERDSVATVIP